MCLKTTVSNFDINIFFFQELSKIAMPVIFNEPLSFLQRLTEYMEHTYLIHQANASTDSIQRMKVAPSFYNLSWQNISVC